MPQPNQQPSQEQEPIIPEAQEIPETEGLDGTPEWAKQSPEALAEELAGKAETEATGTERDITKGRDFVSSYAERSGEQLSEEDLLAINKLAIRPKGLLARLRDFLNPELRRQRREEAKQAREAAQEAIRETATEERIAEPPWAKEPLPQVSPEALADFHPPETDEEYQKRITVEFAALDEELGPITPQERSKLPARKEENLERAQKIDQAIQLGDRLTLERLKRGVAYQLDQAVAKAASGGGEEGAVNYLLEDKKRIDAAIFELQKTREVPRVTTPTEETRTIEAPVAKTIETPAVQMPMDETPTVELPAAKTPADLAPPTKVDLESPTIETPTIKTPAVEQPRVQTRKLGPTLESLKNKALKKLEDRLREIDRLAGSHDERAKSGLTSAQLEAEAKTLLTEREEMNRGVIPEALIKKQLAALDAESRKKTKPIENRLRELDQLAGSHEARTQAGISTQQLEAESAALLAERQTLQTQLDAKRKELTDYLEAPPVEMPTREMPTIEIPTAKTQVDLMPPTMETSVVPEFDEKDYQANRKFFIEKSAELEELRGMLDQDPRNQKLQKRFELEKQLLDGFDFSGRYAQQIDPKENSAIANEARALLEKRKKESELLVDVPTAETELKAVLTPGALDFQAVPQEETGTTWERQREFAKALEAEEGKPRKTYQEVRENFINENASLAWTQRRVETIDILEKRGEATKDMLDERKRLKIEVKALDIAVKILLDAYPEYRLELQGVGDDNPESEILKRSYIITAKKVERETPTIETQTVAPEVSPANRRRYVETQAQIAVLREQMDDAQEEELELLFEELGDLQSKLVAPEFVPLQKAMKSRDAKLPDTALLKQAAELDRDIAEATKKLRPPAKKEEPSAATG